MPGRIRGADATSGKGQKLEDELDKALAETFPASDPFEVGRVTSTEPPARPVDRKAPRPEAPPSRRRKRS
jgi:hypothetical protein